jgi:hypothetical protein
MQIKAAVDRFEGDMAILVFADGLTTLPISKDVLPQGIKEGDWVRLNKDINGEISNITLDAEATKNMEARISDKLAELRKRGSASKSPNG